ncbi:MAG: hypothetical protein NTZ75_06155 [Euryarchaeota archaeon]|nr:hypothetical protein [Euryarchaeota archaeon]
MKKIAIILAIIILLIPILSIPTSSAGPIIRKTEDATPGEIIALSCSNLYPTLGKPMYLSVTVEGKAGKRFNETVSVTDEFCGLINTAGDMTWFSGNVTVSQIVMNVGKLPRYTKKIVWYPSVVGNHTFHVFAGTFPEKQLNVSVGFDVEGIIAPSLGCPSIIIKNNTNQFAVTISEERNTTEEPAQILQVELQSIDNTTHYDLQNQTSTWRSWIKTGTNILEEELIVSYNIDSIPDGFLPK